MRGEYSIPQRSGEKNAKHLAHKRRVTKRKVEILRLMPLMSCKRAKYVTDIAFKLRWRVLPTV